MQKRYFLTTILFVLAFHISAQVTTTPAFITKGYKGEITVTFDPAEGNKGMVGATQCYAHTGLITPQSKNDGDWKYATPKWRDDSEKYKMTQDGDKWILTIPSIHSYYGCPETEEILKIAFVFNDGPNGSKDGKDAKGGDIFVDLVDGNLNVKFESPSENQLINANSVIEFSASASESSDLEILINGESKKTATGTNITYNHTFTEIGNYICMVNATANGNTVSDSIRICVTGTAATEARPTGLPDGITYYADDHTKATLSVYAKDNKNRIAENIFVIGDFNNWEFNTDYQMKKDGTTGYFWLTIEGLTPGKEYAFQYAVRRHDGTIVKVSDAYSEILLDKQDTYISETIYPNLMHYPAEGDGPVSVLRTNEPEFNWSEATLNFKRPDKNNLVIYELWVYDFSPLRSIEGITHRLDYLENLGVNAIELMPVSEFEGNISWGYNPTHYFAFDKAYGTKEMFQTFVDEAHKRGMAVIVDMVFNHATGLNPMNKMFPLADNPFFNLKPPHSDNFFEDWNHDFHITRTHFTRVLNHWLEEYRIDGFRMDLSHGLCGSSSCANCVANLTHFYEQGVKAISPDAYFILEHWNYSERGTLVGKGMLCWENTNFKYGETAMGWPANNSLVEANKDGYVSYAESHDEERNFYKVIQYGNGDLKTNETARLNRVPANVAMSVLLNGPQMMWQFQELGYDYTIGGESERTNPKPMPEYLHWYTNPLRMAQYRKAAQIISLRTKAFPEVFEGNPTSSSLGNGDVMSIIWGEGVNRIFVIANFSATASMPYNLPEGNSWYDYLAGDMNAQNAGTSLQLAPGDVKIYTASYTELPEVPEQYIYDDFVGTETTEMLPQVMLYPTITKGFVNIETTSTIDAVNVYSINGQQMPCGYRNGQIDLTPLPAGLYLIVVNTPTKQIAYKVVKE